MRDILNFAVENSLENAFVNKSYGIDNLEELAVDLNNDLMIQMNGNYKDIEVQVSSNGESKILSVFIKGTYLRADGKEKTIAFKKTVILEEFCE